MYRFAWGWCQRKYHVVMRVRPLYEGHLKTCSGQKWARCQRCTSAFIWMSGWMDWQTDGWMDRRMDGWISSSRMRSACVITIQLRFLHSRLIHSHFLPFQTKTIQPKLINASWLGLNSGCHLKFRELDGDRSLNENCTNEPTALDYGPCLNWNNKGYKCFPDWWILDCLSTDPFDFQTWTCGNRLSCFGNNIHVVPTISVS